VAAGWPLAGRIAFSAVQAGLPKLPMKSRLRANGTPKAMAPKTLTHAARHVSPATKHQEGARMMDKLEIVRVAVRELGEANAQDLSAFIAERFNVKIEPKYIPLFTASLRGKERMHAFREGRQCGAESSK
jgi:hypothetical protein